MLDCVNTDRVRGGTGLAQRRLGAGVGGVEVGRHMEALLDAVRRGNEGDIVRLLGEDPGLLERACRDGNWPLMVAAIHGRLEVVKLFVQRGADASATGVSGKTALEWAAEVGHEEVVTFLLGQGAQSDSWDQNRRTSFILACEKGHVGVVRVLLQYMEENGLQEAEEVGRRALHLAVKGGHWDVAGFLIGKGAPADGKDDIGKTPFMLACHKGNPGMVGMLLQHVGLQVVQETDNEGLMALHYAAYGGHEETVALLLGEGAQADSRDKYNRTPLMLACQEGCMGVLRVLLQHVGREALHETDTQGLTALDLAAFSGHEEVVAYLVSQGAACTLFKPACQVGDLDVLQMLLKHMGEEALHKRDDKDCTALHWAATGETAALLISRGAQTDSRNHMDRTPLMVKCFAGNLGVVWVLAQHMGPEGLDETDFAGRTALYWAARRGHEEVVAFLIGQGAQAHSVADNGSTPLMSACAKGRMGVVQLLLQHVGRQALEDTDDEEWTALHWAAYGGHEEVSTFLLGKGAHANSRNDIGRTPLLVTCYEGHLGTAQFLLQHTGTQALQEMDHQGLTALHCAASGGSTRVVAFLLGEGAQATNSIWDCMTPLMLACDHSHLDVVQLLLQYMEEEALQDTDENGWTALHYAVGEGDEEIVRCLLVAGADPGMMDNEGKTPRDISEEDEGGEDCVALFEWWDCELERRHVLHRAACLHQVYTMQQGMPTSQVPTYLTARVAAEHALPGVEVVMPQPHGQQEEGAVEELADGSGKRKAGGERDGPQGADADEEEGHAVLTYVLTALDEHLLTELLEGFPCEK